MTNYLPRPNYYIISGFHSITNDSTYAIGKVVTGFILGRQGGQAVVFVGRGGLENLPSPDQV